jgi:hypothetical protein
MTIEQLDEIDIITNDEALEVLTLVISDHVEWDEKNEKLFLLQEKLNKYLSFLESGEVYEKYPKIKHGNFLISLVCKYRPAGEGVKFLSLAQTAIEGAGFKFNWGPLNGAYENDNS